MTKIYVVKVGNYDDKKQFINERVFSNRKKAEAYALWLNKQKRFYEDCKNVAWIRTYQICNLDYSTHDELPY